LRLLLDTHIWLWLSGDQKRLGARTSRILESQQHEIWISPVSTYEAVALHLKKKILLPSDPVEWVENAKRGTKEAPFTHEVALATRQFPQDHDPFDRILAATAFVFDLTLLTADQRLLGWKNIKTLRNR
jgi:PIN domain nuclease of toxin-antitoxin system